MFQSSVAFVEWWSISILGVLIPKMWSLNLFNRFYKVKYKYSTDKFHNSLLNENANLNCNLSWSVAINCKIEWDSSRWLSLFTSVGGNAMSACVLRVQAHPCISTCAKLCKPDVVGNFKMFGIPLFLIVDSQSSDKVYFALSFKLCSFTLSSITYWWLLGGIRSHPAPSEPLPTAYFAN